MEFRLLGPLDVLENGAPVPLAGQKDRAVLAILLLHANEPVSVDRLADELWNERPPKTAAASIQNSISALRKALGAERVLTRPAGYVLRVSDDDVDAHRFERLVSRARDAAGEERARLLRQALALWRGPPLADFAFERFAEQEILRLEELRLTAVEDRIDADLDAGRHSQLVSELEALVREHPLRERLRAQLMLALYRSGRQAEALGVFQDTRRTLVEQLGIEPGPGLQRLARGMLRQEAELEPRVAAVTPDHYEAVADALLCGRLVPVVGPGVNRCGRPDGRRWRAGEGACIPDSDELASYLAERFGYPQEEALARVSELVAVTHGVGPLWDELHAALDADFAPGPVHRLLAELPPLLRTRGAPQPVLVTGNYDEAVERAFEEAAEELDVVSYVAEGSSRGKFAHRRPDGRTTLIESGNTYTELRLDERPVLLRIHGRVDRASDRAWESFVVSEDDYINFLAETDIANLLPVTVAARLRRSHFLFLGYSPREWNPRVFLHRLWGDQRLAYRSWAVHSAEEALEQGFWKTKGVEMVDAPLEDYITELRSRLLQGEGAPA